MMPKLSILFLLASACATQAPPSSTPDSMPSTIDPSGTWSFDLAWQSGTCLFLTGDTHQTEIVNGDDVEPSNTANRLITISLLDSTFSCDETSCMLSEHEMIRGQASDGSSYAGTLTAALTLDAASTITGTGTFDFTDSLAAQSSCSQPVVIVGKVEN